jgi:CheY-like chemotaxis protein
VEVQATILLIENDENDVFFFRRCLGAVDARVNVRVVTSAWQARDYMAGRAPYHDRKYYPIPDLIVTDVHLPGASGVEFVQWLREEEKFRSLPLFTMSGSFGSGELAKAVESGLQGHFVKTGDFEKCKGFVSQMLKHLPREKRQGNGGS